jgi:hypothetical protein
MELDVGPMVIREEMWTTQWLLQDYVGHGLLSI